MFPGRHFAPAAAYGELGISPACYNLVMVVVHHEFLSGSLLLLAPGTPNQPPAALAHWLRGACCDYKPAVWVDCSLLPSPLPANAARQLWAAHERLRQQHIELVLAHVPPQVREAWFAGHDSPCVLPTLLDAAHRSQLRAPLAATCGREALPVAA